jgi:hypothetical protein
LKPRMSQICFPLAKRLSNVGPPYSISFKRTGLAYIFSEQEISLLIHTKDRIDHGETLIALISRLSSATRAIAS